MPFGPLSMFNASDRLGWDDERLLVNGDIQIDLLLKGVPKSFVSRYLQVWAKRSGEWQMVAWQSTPVPSI
jgi:hypothetical protein